MKTLTIGTRGSALALWQANHIKKRIEDEHEGVTVVLDVIKTTGDIILDVPLAKVGGKGLFVKEIEEALLRKDVDLAVHSMKDVPTELPDSLYLSAVTERHDPRDAFLSVKYNSFKELPQGATLGTSSLRRQCQLCAIRPDLKIAQLRGNVGTRIRKMKEGQYDAIILAAAGLKRLGIDEDIKELLSTEISIPAIGQGALGIESRIGDDETYNLIAFLNHTESAYAVKAERAFLMKLEGGCQVPIAGFGTIDGDTIHFSGLVGSETGDVILKDSISGNVNDAEKLGVELAQRLLDRGADKILKEVYEKTKA
ncbi:hydroxymethylbilane synthase [Thermodesulfobacteriota bacterium]